MGIMKDPGSITIRFPKKIVGVKEVWQQIIKDYVATVQRVDIKTIVIDSATRLWELCHRAYLQELQEKQIATDPKVAANDNLLREKLLPIEYGEPNDRMRTIIYTARSFNKDLVLTHYPRDVYAQRVTERGIEEYRTGAIELDGFKDTKKLIDLIVMTSIDTTKKVPIGKITTSGLSLGLVDMIVSPLDYETLIKMVKMCRGES